MKYAVGIEYDGTDFCGWQIQSHARSVQSCVETAFSQVAGAPMKLVGAGRTDSGVHALTQVAHFGTDVQRDIFSWLRGANAHLPEDVAVLWVKPVSDDFHARFSALRRYYRYVIFNHPERSALYRRTSVRVHRPLDESAMHRAAQALVGEHDFSSFRAQGCQADSPIRQVFSIRVCRREKFVWLTVCANAFLQRMVRNIAGVLIAIGVGDRPEAWAAEVLARRDRRQGGITAGSCGLYLTDVEYAPRFGLHLSSEAGLDGAGESKGCIEC